jgi:phosphotransferase system IIA component
MVTTNKIFIQIGEDKIELTGADKEEFIADREATAEAQRLLEAEYQAKKELRTNAITKLGQASGLTEEEINAILGL